MREKREVGRFGYLFMYSEVRSLLHFLQMKQKRCQCLSSAISDWQLLMDSLQPAHSVRQRERERVTEGLMK